jgi:hypothetical protein
VVRTYRKRKRMTGGIKHRKALNNFTHLVPLITLLLAVTRLSLASYSYR